MATTSKLTASNGIYGHSGSNEYSTASANHLYVGKSSGTSDYRSRLSFPAISSLAEVGSSRFRITKLLLYIRRNESGSAATITASCASSSEWGAAPAATVSGTIANNTDDYQTIDLTALGGAAAEYTSKWYLHISGSTPRVRFDSTGRSKKPYLEVTWEHVAATIRGNRDSAALGTDAVTFTITPEVSGETHTLTYSLGDSAGTIAENAGDSITWTPPLSLASEITHDDTAAVEVRMTAYDSGGSVQRTETYYQTVIVPSSVAPVISKTGRANVNALSGYLLAGHSALQFAPEIDMTGTYGATVQSLTASLSDGQIIQWTSLASTDAGVYAAAAAKTGALPEGDGTATITVTDSRGREVSKTVSYRAYPYSPPVITDFDVFRYEEYYDENETSVGEKPSDVGKVIAVTLMAEAASVAPAGKQLNLLQYAIVGTNEDTGESISGVVSGNDFLDENDQPVQSGRRIRMLFDKEVFPGEFGADEAWSFTVTVTDTAGGSAVQYAAVAPGHAALSLSPDKWGAAVGMIAAGTKDSPRFEVAEAYETHFYGDVFDRHGSAILGCAVVSSDAYSKSFADKEEAAIPLCSTPGLYLVTVNAAWNKTSGSGRLYAGVKTDGGVYYAESHVESSSVAYPSHNICAVVTLPEGRTMQLVLAQYTGGSLTMLQCRYQVVRIG